MAAATRKKSAGETKTPNGKKAATRKTTGRKKTSNRKYSPKASRKVARSIEEMQDGTLRSGRSGKKVTSRKQAIAIGLNEARREGDDVPERKRKS